MCFRRDRSHYPSPNGRRATLPFLYGTKYKSILKCLLHRANVVKSFEPFEQGNRVIRHRIEKTLLSYNSRLPRAINYRQLVICRRDFSSITNEIKRNLIVVSLSRSNLPIRETTNMNRNTANFIFERKTRGSWTVYPVQNLERRSFALKYLVYRNVTLPFTSSSSILTIASRPIPFQ